MMGAYNRDVSKRKALRNRRLARMMYHYSWEPDSWEYYGNLHQYSKNKIHCSCSGCSVKTRNKGKRRAKRCNHNRSLNYKASDLRRLMAMDTDEKEFQ
jgi:predicted nucleic acid-binding Zn finger protein